jgi:release factor glutamine methyltransferase
VSDPRGSVVFGGLELLTDPGRVMTPRAASLALVECVLKHIGNEPARVVDVGTGSGAIAIAVAAAAPKAEVWATDVGDEAVALAGLNAARCGVRVRVRRGDLLDPVPPTVDVVVANLPYLPWSERPQHSDLEPEPAAAVFATGDGLGAYRRLRAAADERLAPGGLFAVQLRGELIAADAAELARLDPVFAEEAA